MVKGEKNMNNTRKILTAATCLAVIVGFVSTINKQGYTSVSAEGQSSENLWGEALNEFLETDYAPIKNQKITGKYYKVGIMGHRRVVSFGDVQLKTSEFEKYTDNTSYGALKDLKFTNTKSHEVGSKTTYSLQIDLGFSEIIKAGFTFGGFANVGIEKGKTIEGKFGIEKSYWETDIESVEIEQNLALDNLIDGRNIFRYSKVACYVEAEIKESYTEEQNMFGKWGKVGGTHKKNYKARYYICDTNVFVYPTKKTFGDKVIGEYKLDEIIKAY